MKGIFIVVGSGCIFLAGIVLTINGIVAAFGGGTEYSIQANLLRIIALGIVGIGFLQISKPK